MTDKELHKLRRSELLEILIEQKKSVAAMEKQVEDERAAKAAAEASLRELEENCRCFRDMLDAKDERIRELTQELEQQGRTAAVSEESEKLAEVTDRLTRAVDLITKAAEKYEKTMSKLSKKNG